MNKSRPSNVLIRIIVAIFLGLSVFVIAAVVYHVSQAAKQSDEGIGEPEQELLNEHSSQPNPQRLI